MQRPCSAHSGGVAASWRTLAQSIFKWIHHFPPTSLFLVPDIFIFTGEITWTVTTRVAFPPAHESKRSFWRRMRDILLAADWDLLLCSAGSLSAIFCHHAMRAGRMALDLGTCDSMMLA
jgi:hypothetical protein